MQMKAPHRTMELGASDLSLLLRLDQPLLGPLRVRQQSRVHQFVYRT